MSAIKCCGARWDSRIEICPRCQKRLEGTSPAGPPSESGCGDAERRNNQATPNIPHGSAVVEAKGRVALLELYEYIEGKAARLQWAAGLIGSDELDEVLEEWKKDAADKQRWTDALAGLLGLPRPQSGEDGVEECQCVPRFPLVDTMNGDVCGGCYLPMARGKRKERSGLHNARSVPPVTPGKKRIL